MVEEMGRGTVIEVTFNGNDPEELVQDNGWFGIVASTDESITTDLSAFADGAVSFDMRILKNGNAQDMLLLNMDCIYPCTSAEIWVADPAELGQWQTYNISMQQLVATGLDITRVNNLFNFKPNWGQQLGQYVIQLDNIQLKKSYSPTIELPEPPTTSVQKIFYQDGRQDDAGLAISNSFSAELTEEWQEGKTVINLVFLADEPASEFWIFTSQREDMTDYFYGEIVLDLQVVSYGDNPGEILLNSFCGWPCRAVPEYSIGRPAEGDWQTYRIPVRELVESGLRLDRVVNPIFLKFNGPTRQGLEINLNNIRWEYNSPVL